MGKGSSDVLICRPFIRFHICVFWQTKRKGHPVEARFVALAVE